MNVALLVNIFAIIIDFITSTTNFSLENATFTRVISESLTNTTQQLKLEFHLQNVLRSTCHINSVNFKCILFGRFESCWEKLEIQYGNVSNSDPNNPHRRPSTVAINPNLPTLIQQYRCRKSSKII